ncbi:MAG TPA: C4-type zinc ribbon domain-containing protein, partial [Candidatus Acidoferrales bacterium]|nr:C4-type zinc ribbon domain-containing protein [Candidatus Acidoferrales bacterium]
SEDLLRHYERVMKLRGSGLAEVRDQKCMGCQVMLRPQVYNEVRIGEKVVICDSCQRIYYYIPANEVKPEQEVATVTGRKRARPKADAPQAWYYRPDYAEEGEVLLVFINNGGSSTRRIYEMHTGRQVGGVLLREGNYRLAFPEDLTDAALRLNGHWEEKEIDEWGSEIPSNALDLLHKDLLAIRREHKATHKHAASPAEQPAAS